MEGVDLGLRMLGPEGTHSPDGVRRIRSSDLDRAKAGGRPLARDEEQSLCVGRGCQERSQDLPLWDADGILGLADLRPPGLPPAAQPPNRVHVGQASPDLPGIPAQPARGDRRRGLLDPGSPRAPVSVPDDSDELPSLGSGARFDVARLPGRLSALRRDPWAGFERAARPLEVAVRRRRT